MRCSTSRLGIIFACILGATGVARAQMGPGGGMGGMGGMGGPGGATQPAADAKKEGVAEAAPKAAALPTTPTLAPAKGKHKQWKLLELDGYWRLRTDYWRNFNLGFTDDPANPSATGGSPFPRALGCTGPAGSPCNHALADANTRLRFEPVLHIDEGTSVHVQADALDNLVLGSTPTGEGYNGVYTASNPPPVTSAFGNGNQSPPVRGVNSATDSFVVKRAWAEVAVPLGVINAGRMPNSWGMGIYYNSVGYDPVSGTYDYDGDYGDTVDRLSFTAQIPGTDLKAMIAMDWDLTRLVSSQTGNNKGNEEHPFDLDDSSDTNGWVAQISRIDSPQEFKDKVDRGDLALNWGVHFEYKTQSWDEDLTGYTIGTPFDSADHYIPRNLTSYTGDLFGKLGIGSFLVEGEFVGQIGSVDNLQNLTTPATYTTENLRKFGGAARGSWLNSDRKLKVGIESGFATGDQWDNKPQGNTNIAYANLLGSPTECSSTTITSSRCTLTQFMFNPEYKVDLILWRRLIGAVTNAAYFKPFIQYELTKGLTVKLADITSIALKPVATPGNKTLYGTEIDADIGYQSGHLFTGISGGILLPGAAMDHPDASGGQGPGFGYGTDTGNASTAYAIQTRLVLAF